MNPLEIITFPGSFTDLPEPDVPYYVATSKGPFLHKRTVLGRVWVKVDKIDHLPDPDEDAERNRYIYSAPQIPGLLIGQAVAWFRRIWEEHHTEAALLITYKEDDPRLFRLFAPPQKCGGAHVEFAYDPTTIEEGWAVVGSIHSHCNFSAHHSGTDTKDATDIPGIHITIGHVDRDDPDFDLFMAAQDVEFPAAYQLICEPWVRDATPPRHWDRYYSKDTASALPKPKTEPKVAWGQQLIPFKPTRTKTWDDIDYYGSENYPRYWSSTKKYSQSRDNPQPPASAPYRPTAAIPTADLGFATVQDIDAASDDRISDTELKKDNPIAWQVREQLYRVVSVADELMDLGLDLDWSISEI